MIAASLLFATLAYLIGSIPFGLLLTQAFSDQDVRKIGSGNIGATNVLRTGSKTLAAATFILDMGKAALPILVIEQLAQAGLPTEPWWPPMVALAACLGHCFPPWLRFRGGKAVASFLGAWLALSLIGGLALCLTWLVVALVWRWSSLAALSATFAAPILAWGDPVALGFAIALSALVWVRHAGNLRRLLADEEPKIGQK